MSAARVRRWGLGGAAALGLVLAATPLAAQTAPAAMQPEEELPPARAEGEDGAVLPFDLKVVGGDEQSVAAHPIGAALPSTERVCLDRRQFLMVTAKGEQLDYAGPGCLEPRDDAAIPADVYAGSHIWHPLTEDSPGWSGGDGCSAVVVAASGPSADAFAPGRRLAADEQIVLQAGDRISVLNANGARTLTGPGTFPAPCSTTGASRGLASALPARRARFGALRGLPAAEGAPAQRLIATRGTAGALKKFPRGTLITSPQKVCLAEGDRLTVAARSGARMTFAGPGCGRRLPNADDDNTPAVSPG